MAARLAVGLGRATPFAQPFGVQPVVQESSQPNSNPLPYPKEVPKHGTCRLFQAAPGLICPFYFEDLSDSRTDSDLNRAKQVTFVEVTSNKHARLGSNRWLRIESLHDGANIQPVVPFKSSSAEPVVRVGARSMMPHTQRNG
jgi:hypothetical protein